MTLKLVVDRRMCLKSGQCTYLHPELLAEGPDGYPQVLVEAITDENRDAADEAVDVCPAQAITLEEE